MKKFLAILLALVMCFSFFTGCRKTPDPEPTPTPEVSDNANDKLDADAAQSAIAYLKNMYKNVDEITAKDFQRIGVVPVGATKVQVVWTVDVSEDLIKIVVEENGMVTIDVNEECTEETPYVLTATVTDAEGKAHTLSWNHILPAKQDALDILKAAYALAPGQELGYEVTLTGVITKVDTPYDANYGNISVIMVVDGYEEYPILCYRLKGTGAENLTKEDTITVTGTIVNYNGTIEFNSGCVLDSYVKGDYVPSQAPDSMTQIVDEAYALGANQELDYIAVLTGKITKIKTPYDTGYGNISVEIEVEGREGKPILCYRMKGPGAETLEINDTITVSGTITNYVGSSGYSTIEYKAGCTLLNVVKGSGAPKAPDSMTQIVDEAYALGANQDLLYEATLTGVITKVKTPYDSGYNNVSVEIVVAGREDKPILCYRMKGTGADIIDVGDTITVKGYITNYVGDKGYNTIEYKAGCQLLSYVINDKTATLEEAATKLQESYPDGFKNGIELVDALTVRTTEFTVAWAVETANEVAAKIVDGKLVLTPADEDVDYKLTATISNAAGETKTVSWDLVVSTKFLEVTQVTGAPEVGVAYKWGLVQKKLDGKPTLYFAGAMNGYYGATTKNAEEAVDVVLETAEGGYYLSFTDPDGAKKYVNVVVSGTHINFTIADTAATVYAFNSEIGTLTTKLDNETYYIGTYGTFNTLSVSNLSYITGDKAGDLDTYSFPARFFTAKWVSGAATLEEGVEQLKADYADGFTNGIELNAITTVRNTGFTTTWKLTSGDTAAKIEDGKLVLTSQATETAYILVATITDGTDTKDVIFSYKVPALPTAADAVAALQEKYAEDHKFKNGDALDSTIVLKDDTYEVSFDITWAVTAGGTVAKVEEGKLVFNPSDVDVDYTMTATVAKGEDSATVSWDGVVSNTYLQVTPLEGTPEVGIAYKYGLYQANKGKTLYFSGEKDGNFFATTDDPELAVDMYIEEVTGGYLFYFLDGETKKYIDIYEYTEGKIGIQITETPVGVFYYHEDAGTYVVDVLDETRYLGTFENYETISSSKIYYITGDNAANVGVTQFVAGFYTAEWVSGSATVAEGAAQLENTYADGIDNGTELPTTVQVRNTTFTVSDWTVTAGSAAAKIEGGKLILTSQTAATEYTLTAIVTDAEDGTKTVTITGTVPALPTAADAIAKLQEKYAADYKFKNGDILDKTVVISGDTFEDITFDVVWTVTVAEGKPAVATVEDYTLVYSPSDEDVDYTLIATVESTATASWNGTVANTFLKVTLLEGAPVVGTAYKWGVVQNKLGKTFYFAGAMDGYYGATSEDVEVSVDVVLEAAEGGYYLSFTDPNGAKKYVNVVASGTYTNFAIADTASTVYTYNADIGTLTTVLSDVPYYIGTYSSSKGDYTTLSCSKLSYITSENLDVTQFPARFYTAEWVSGNATLAEGVEQLKADYADGFTNYTALQAETQVRNTKFATTWEVTVGADAAMILPTVDGKYLKMTSQATETPYTLVATLTDAENNTETVTFTGIVPALPTAADAIAKLQEKYAADYEFKNGEELDKTVVISGDTYEVTFDITWTVDPESAAAKVENDTLVLTAQSVDTAYTLVATVNGTATATWTGTVAAAEVEPAGDTYTKITSMDQLVSGQYVMVVGSGYAPGIVDGTWITAVQPVVEGDKVTDTKGAVWTLTVEGTTVTIQDSNGVYIAPKGGNNNGLKTGNAYSWDVVFADGTFRFAGTGSDTVTLASNTDPQYANKFRGYKNATITDTAKYPSAFALYKLDEVVTPSEPTYNKIASMDELASGQYVMVVGSGYAPGIVDGTWITAVQPVVEGDKVTDTKGAVWTLTVEGTTVTIQDSNGVYIAPKGGNNNGLKTGNAYSWDVVFADGTFRFAGTGSDTVTLASNTDPQYANKFRGYKNATITDTAKYPSTFTLYKLTGAVVEPEPEPQPEGVTAGLLTELPVNGDVIVIANGTKAMTGTASGKKLAAVDAVITDNMLTLTDDLAQLTVSVDANNYYTFTVGDKYLTSGATGNSLTLEAAASDYSLWTVESAGDGIWYIKNVNAKYNGNVQSMEYYSGFTTYGHKAQAAYQMKMFKVAAAEPEEPVNTLMAEMPANGDVVVIANGTKAMTATASGKKLAAVDAVITDNVLTLTDDMAQLAVSIDANNYYTFTAGGKYLTSGATGNSLTLEDAASDYSLWTVESAGDGIWYIKNVNAKYNSNVQSMEYYSGFTTYGHKAQAAYQMKFFKVGVAEPKPDPAPDTNAPSYLVGEYTYGSYDKYSNVIKNWGTRGTTAEGLSPNALAFYTEAGTSYDTLDDLAGSTNIAAVPTSALYLELQELMEDAHTNQTTYGETRYLFPFTDGMNAADGTLTCFYSGASIGPEWDKGSTWNREHCWPKSKTANSPSSVNNEDTGVNADLMTLRPTASSLNQSRSNKAYGTVTNDSFYNPNTVSNGTYDLRGDVARIVLYTYVRWGETNLFGETGVIESVDVLLTWMEADPVDTWELGRNDSVESVTGTRNVFVDYPELAFLLFGEEIPAAMATPMQPAA